MIPAERQKLILARLAERGVLSISELTELLEKEFSVEADLEKLDECVSPADIKAYFMGLIGTP